MELPTPKREQYIQHMLTVLAFAIPWAKKAVPTIIVISLLVALFYALRKKTIIKPIEPLAPIGLLSLFLLLLIGTTYTEHPNEAWNEIGIKLSFLVFPLLAFISPNLSRSQVSVIQHAFVSGCFLFIGITTAHSTYETIQHRDIYYTTYDRLSWYMHPTYAALYQNFALFILGSMFIRRQYVFNSRYIHASAGMLVLIFIALLSSKAGYLTTLLVLISLLSQSIRVGWSTARSMVAVSVAISMFLLIILNLRTTSQRVENAMKDLRTAEEQISRNDSTSYQATSTHMRLLTWQSSATVLLENPFGTGTGDAQQALNTIYLQKSATHPAESNLNAHNQFLQLGAELGWPGLFIILLCLYALWNSGKRNEAIRIFVLICTLNFLFESMLEVQAGIVFFCFWAIAYSKASDKEEATY
jgi:O-antigen ligase